MLALRRLTYRLFAVTLAAIALCARPAAAEDAPAGENPGVPPTQIGLISAKSIDAAAAFARQLGTELPANVTAARIEETFPFIGQGGLATDKPIGMIFFGGQGLTPEQSIAIVLPIKPNAAPLDELKKSGMAVPGHPDTVALDDGTALRRTADYLIIGKTPVVSVAKAEVLAKALKGPDALVRAAIDLKALRQAMPEHFKAIVDAMKKQALSQTYPDEAQRAGARMFIDGFQEFLEKSDRVELGVDNGAAALRLFATAAPMELPPVMPGDRPGMPEGVIVRLDLSARPTSMMDTQFMKLAMADAQKDMTAEQKKKLKDFIAGVQALYLGGDRVSVGFEMGDSPVGYIVNHYAKPIDYAAELGRVIDQAKAFGDAIKEPTETELQTYDAGGAKVVRLVMLDKQKPQVYIDAVQRGSDVLVAISDKDAHYIDRLLAAKSGGPMRGLASGSVDLAKLFDAATKQPDSPVAGMSAEQRKQLADLLRGQKLSASFSSEGDAATFDMIIPQGLIKNASKLAEVFAPGAGGAETPPDPAPK
jgi:hypothetical protein